ncbi:hypothetical protein GGI04_000159 [Coemansia thaxteri]|uniref:Amino acid transporter transmembrane domain-containing protein n=1 Tax=Coemansia thaxteri TaxID=2663907 RepID=A0A9W8EDH1_9FUNG|nr:hypothetical protein H4R26_004993 [Coemansia thaxteri]KAJ2009747.1 hypothetical protein GGI04_000159 [Coemansia thaxteri]KAJ2474386.1 hypothetical protein GGI02_000096 [Coemansia sp. RSA 2322]KAJ2475527.1 hypothetical protein EV174_005243 [Coemansia sp. RSA 2320]
MLSRQTSSSGDKDCSTRAEDVPTQRTGSSGGAMLNLVCVVIGTGALNLAHTLQQSGWLGLLLVGVSGAVSVFTGVLVIRSLDQAGGARRLGQLGQAAFGLAGRIAVHVLHCVVVVGSVGDYIILAGQSFDRLARAGGHGSSETAWKIGCAAAMWAGCIGLRHMSDAVALALLGSATSLSAVLIGAMQALRHPYRGSGPAPHAPAYHRLWNGAGAAVALATISFAYCAVAVMPAVEASMRRPGHWTTVLGLAMGIVTAVYLLVAAAGYWAFGDQTAAPFLDNLPPGAATSAARILISLHVILAAPIMATSFALEIEAALGLTQERWGKWRELALRVALRSLFFVAMTAIALAVPFFGDVMALVGAFSTSLLLCVVPVVCYIRICGWRTLSWPMLIACLAVFALGIYTCVLGAKGAIEDLRKDIAARGRQ